MLELVDKNFKNSYYSHNEGKMLTMNEKLENIRKEIKL
jgi:hypothetical protein